MLFLLFCVGGSLAQTLLCDRFPPAEELTDVLSVCRGLNYAHCVERPLGSGTEELSQLTFETDQALVHEYASLSSIEPPSCIAAWINMRCSSVFPQNVDAAKSNAPCASVCEEVARHCFNVRCEPAPPLAACTDFRGLVRCAESPAETPAPTPQRRVIAGVGRVRMCVVVACFLGALHF